MPMPSNEMGQVDYNVSWRWGLISVVLYRHEPSAPQDPWDILKTQIMCSLIPFLREITSLAWLDLWQVCTETGFDPFNQVPSLITFIQTGPQLSFQHPTITRHLLSWISRVTSCCDQHMWMHSPLILPKAISNRRTQFSVDFAGTEYWNTKKNFFKDRGKPKTSLRYKKFSWFHKP